MKKDKDMKCWLCDAAIIFYKLLILVRMKGLYSYGQEQNIYWQIGRRFNRISICSQPQISSKSNQDINTTAELNCINWQIQNTDLICTISNAKVTLKRLVLVNSNYLKSNLRSWMSGQWWMTPNNVRSEIHL